MLDALGSWFEELLFGLMRRVAGLCDCRWVFGLVCGACLIVFALRFGMVCCLPCLIGLGMVALGQITCLLLVVVLVLSCGFFGLGGFM